MKSIKKITILFLVFTFEILQCTALNQQWDFLFWKDVTTNMRKMHDGGYTLIGNNLYRKQVSSQPIKDTNEALYKQTMNRLYRFIADKISFAIESQNLHEIEQYKGCLNGYCNSFPLLNRFIPDCNNVVYTSKSKISDKIKNHFSQVSQEYPEWAFILLLGYPSLVPSDKDIENIIKKLPLELTINGNGDIYYKNHHQKLFFMPSREKNPNLWLLRSFVKYAVKRKKLAKETYAQQITRTQSIIIESFELCGKIHGWDQKKGRFKKDQYKACIKFNSEHVNNQNMQDLFDLMRKNGCTPALKCESLPAGFSFPGDSAFLFTNDDDTLFFKTCMNKSEFQEALNNACNTIGIK